MQKKITFIEPLSEEETRLRGDADSWGWYQEKIVPPGEKPEPASWIRREPPGIKTKAKRRIKRWIQKLLPPRQHWRKR